MPNLVRIVIQLPVELKEQLDALKSQGYTTSGFIRAMLERELTKPELKLVANSRRAMGKTSTN
jgi:predicted DNA-binding protein